MLYEAGYTIRSRTLLLLLYRFTVIPLLGPRPTSPTPRFRSAVNHGVGDGTPISYRWSWGTVIQSQPQVFLFFEPIGALTGTMADSLNENAAKTAVLILAKIYPFGIDLSMLWTFAAYLRPHMTKHFTGKSAAGVMVLELHCRTDASVSASLSTQAPTELPKFFRDVLPEALHGVYGVVDLKPLNALQNFVTHHPLGRNLTILSTTGIDCLSLGDARVKCHAISKHTSPDHIEAVLTLGGAMSVSKDALAQLRELLTVMNGSDLPDACHPPANAHTSSPTGISFIFELDPAYNMPRIHLEVDITKYARSAFHAVQAVSAFLTQRAQGRDAEAYMNVLHGILGEPYGPMAGTREQEINAWRGPQGSFTFSIEKGESRMRFLKYHYDACADYLCQVISVSCQLVNLFVIAAFTTSRGSWTQRRSASGRVGSSSLLSGFIEYLRSTVNMRHILQ
jgi:DMATS type aromatic prenyltransferase